MSLELYVLTGVLMALTIVCVCFHKTLVLSCRVAFHSPDISLAYLPEFVAKTKSEWNPLPHSFLARSLEEFVGDLPDEHLLCPFQVVRTYLSITSSVSPRPCSLLVSPRCPSRELSKNALSFFLQHVILNAGVMEEGALPLRAHSIRAVAALAAVLRNWSVSKGLEATTWRSNPVFASFYFHDISYSLDSLHSLGPFVAGGSVLPYVLLCFSSRFRVFSYRVRGCFHCEGVVCYPIGTYVTSLGLACSWV